MADRPVNHSFYIGGETIGELKLEKKMKTFYRGFLIREDIRSICYTILGMRPDRPELATVGTYFEAMKLLDRLIFESSESEDTANPIFVKTPISNFRSEAKLWV
jgi:hypothetical protein